MSKITHVQNDQRSLTHADLRTEKKQFTGRSLVPLSFKFYGGASADFQSIPANIQT